MVSHFDFPCAFLGASNQCISDLFRLPEIEARRAHAEQLITADNDHLNGWQTPTLKL